MENVFNVLPISGGVDTPLVTGGCNSVPSFIILFSFSEVPRLSLRLVSISLLTGSLLVTILS